VRKQIKGFALFYSVYWLYDLDFLLVYCMIRMEYFWWIY